MTFVVSSKEVQLANFRVTDKYQWVALQLTKSTTQVASLAGKLAGAAQGGSVFPRLRASVLEKLSEKCARGCRKSLALFQNARINAIPEHFGTMRSAQEPGFTQNGVFHRYATCGRWGRQMWKRLWQELCVVQKCKITSVMVRPSCFAGLQLAVGASWCDLGMQVEVAKRIVEAARWVFGHGGAHVLRGIVVWCYKMHGNCFAGRNMDLAERRSILRRCCCQKRQVREAARRRSSFTQFCIQKTSCRLLMSHSHYSFRNFCPGTAGHYWHSF